MSETTQTEEQAEEPVDASEEENVEEQETEIEETARQMQRAPVYPALFSLDDITSFKNLVILLKSVTEEAILTADRQGIHFASMDQQHVSLVQLEVSPDSVQTFKYEGDQASRFALRVKDLEAILKRTSKTDSVLIFLQDANTAIVTLRGSRDRSYALNLIETVPNSPPIPNIDYSESSAFSIVRGTLVEALRDAEAIADQATLVVSNQGITFTSRSDVGQYLQAIKKGDPELISVECNNPQGEDKATFSTGLLLGVLGSVVDVAALSCQAGTKKPMRVEMPLSSMNIKARVVFWLAPRISDDAPKQAPPMVEPDEAPAEEAPKEPSNEA